MTNNPYFVTVDSVTTEIANTTTRTVEILAAPVPECTPCPITAPHDTCQILDSKCAGRSVIPSAVYYIVYTQCFLFALFGVVLTVQLCIASTVHGKETEAWYFVSLIYAVLSVTAETALEVGFLVMISQMPESVPTVPDGVE